jgi:hypothetical protein
VSEVLVSAVLAAKRFLASKLRTWTGCLELILVGRRKAYVRHCPPDDVAA